MKTPLLVFLVVFFVSQCTQINAQRNCGTTEYLEQQLQSNPKLKQKMEIIEKATRVFENKKLNSRVEGVITIPVVVHVVHKNATENISNAQINSQIDILNEDFRRLNADASNTPSDFLPYASDVEFEFCLATVDPQGGASTGITRTSTSVSSFNNASNIVKFTFQGGKDAWPSSDYLNIWVCDLSGSFLGYAQFPGGAAVTDGVVIDYLYFGNIGTASAPFDKGRTLTHEIGHWLNLRHIWGDGNCNFDDLVSDTPKASKANLNSSPCTYPGTNSCDEGVGDLPDMFQNYMDYSDDECMNLFTMGQKTRMRALFDVGGFRESILNSNGCGTPTPPTCNDGFRNGNETGIDCGGPDCVECPPCVDVVIDLTFDDFPEETSWEILNEGSSIVASGGLYGGQPDGSTLQIIECLPEGCYDFIIYDAYGDGICCGSFGNGAYEVLVEGNIVASGGDFTSSESTNFCLSTTYSFIGPGIDWNDPANWDKGVLPPLGYAGKLIITSDCVWSGKGLTEIKGELIIKSGVTLSKNE